MIIIGIILALVGLAYLCWLLFALAVYALPFFAGVTAGLATYHSGSGPIPAIIVGAIAGSITLLAAQIAFTASLAPHSRRDRAPLRPAGCRAGYHAALGLAHIGISAEGWRHAVAVRARSSWRPRPGRAWRFLPRPVPDRALPPA